MKRILSTLVVLLAVMLNASAQNIFMKVTLNSEQKVKDKDGKEVVLGGVLELPCDAFTSIEYIVQEIKDDRAVDLGLSSGTQWALMNYGAASEKEVGTQLAWTALGQITTEWGEYWTVPTQQQTQELINECTWRTVYDNNDNFIGYTITSKKNSNSIFLPATKGYIDTDGSTKRKGYSFYWTSTGNSTKGTSLELLNEETEGEFKDWDAVRKMAVRPVWVKTETPVEINVKLTLAMVGEPTETGATCSIAIETNGEVETCGVQYATSPNALANATKIRANISGSSAMVTLTSLEPGTKYYVRAYATAKYTDKTFYSDNVSFETAEQVVLDEYAKAKPVDLGLSVKWASWNMGSQKIGDMGKYIGWGVLSDEVTSTNASDYAPQLWGDDKVLAGDDQYDIATSKWGNGWSIPTMTQWRELASSCDWKQDTEIDSKGNTVHGFRVTGRGSYSDRSIFLPWAGFRSGTSYSYVDQLGWYWTANCSGAKGSAYAAQLLLGSVELPESQKCLGMSIRPVYNGVVEEDPANDPSMQVYSTDSDGAITPVEGVDMGGNIKWAQWNVGAKSYGDSGNFYSWGETEPKPTYSNDTYTCDLKGKYGDNISGFKNDQDVARTKWKRKWRMPTIAEFRQLILSADSKKWIYDANAKCSGLKVTKGPRSIFFPVAGYYVGANLTQTTAGFYWSTTPYSDYERAQILRFDSSTPGVTSQTNRYYGLLVRPVWDDSLPYLE